MICAVSRTQISSVNVSIQVDQVVVLVLVCSVQEGDTNHKHLNSLKHNM
jgi:hypothetical protein